MLNCKNKINQKEIVLLIFISRGKGVITMEEAYTVFVPLHFFERLLPFQALLLKGNAFKVWAMGAQKRDGSVVRSKEFLLFANGLATVVVQKETQEEWGKGGYVMSFSKKTDSRGLTYWLVEGVSEQYSWERKLCISTDPVAIQDKNCRLLCSIEGDPGQYIYLYER